jgi:8-oxo-dGTP diphosphatase
MKQILRAEILKLKNEKYVDQQILAKHLEFLEKEKEFTRPQNPLHHFGIYFLPIHKKSRSIYLVHHKKANQWIPAGEHLEEGETSVQAVIRGCHEELQYSPEENSIELFDLSITNIRNIRSRPCRTHFDIWYLVEMKNKVNFAWDKREFYEAKWFKINDAIKKIKRENYSKIISRINNSF